MSQAAEAPRTIGSFLRFLLRRIVEQRVWWMIPFWAMLVALGVVLWLSGNGALLPAIYIAF